MRRKQRRGLECTARCTGCAHAFAMSLTQFAPQPYALIGIEQGRIGRLASPTHRRKKQRRQAEHNRTAQPPLAVATGRGQLARIIWKAFGAHRQILGARAAQTVFNQVPPCNSR